MDKKELFERLFNGVVTEEDYNELVTIFESSDIALFDEYCRQLWDENNAGLSGEQKADMKADIMKRISAQEKRTRVKKRLNFLKWSGAVAAAVALVLVLFYSILPVNNNVENIIKPECFEIVVARGQKSTLTLPDGSRVWINSATRISYTSDYNSKDRNVYLDGEAYFEVASGNELPFTVYADNLQVTALGTKFNVNAYSDDKAVRTILLEGKVSTEAGNNSSILTPYQEALYDKSSGTIAVSDVPDHLHAVPWLKDEILFDNDPLSEIAVTLERMYNVNVIFADEKVKEYSYTGLIRNNSLQNVLELISSTSPVDYRITSDTIKFFVK
jgi:ferric-dicitrate binding protein FerR (iron transport regulator)